MIIDFHTHAFPDTVAQYAIPTLEKKSNIKAAGDGTVSDLLASMERSGVDRSVLCPVSTKVDQVSSINKWVAGLRDSRLIPFGTLFPGMTDPQEEARRLNDAGIKGVKLHPEYQNFYVDDEQVFPLYEACCKYNLIVLFHAGLDIGIPPPYHATPKRMSRMLERFPELNVVAAHLGGYLMWDDVRTHLVGKNLYFDLAYFSAGYDENTFHTIMREHGMDRILFATDYPWLDQAQGIEEFSSWPLTEEERNMIFAENACRLLGIE